MVNNYSNESAFRRFLNKNKLLKFFVPLLAVLVIVWIFVYSGVVKQSTPSSGKENPSQVPASSQSVPPVEQPQVEVLPQITRSDSNETVEPIKDPFETPMKLTGIIYSSERAVAIIESNGVSYIVQMNETVGDSSWKVSIIEESFLILESNGKSVTLTLSSTADNS